ncbi:MAG: tRNA (5-methylaminomethyl-2-thiouridine)(34)-methyltransferase MnmD, partial [Pseudomonadota bacterium]
VIEGRGGHIACAPGEAWHWGGFRSEAHYVFLGGNDLPARFCPGFTIAELGFGTGLNLLAAAQAWRATKQQGPLRFVSFEAHPLAPRDMARALRAFAPPQAEALVTAWEQSTGLVRTFSLDGVEVEVFIGMADAMLPRWDGLAQAWFLDGFAPAKNPQMWTPDLMAQVAKHTAANGSFATYTAASAVRRALEQAGFVVARPKGFAKKRQMMCGTLG